MNQDDFIYCFRTNQIQEKILVESALTEAKICFEMLQPRVSARTIYQDFGPWDFYVRKEDFEKAKSIIVKLPVDTEPEPSTVRVVMPLYQRIFAFIFFGLTAVAIIYLFIQRMFKS